MANSDQRLPSPVPFDSVGRWRGPACEIDSVPIEIRGRPHGRLRTLFSRRTPVWGNTPSSADPNDPNDPDEARTSGWESTSMVIAPISGCECLIRFG
jgi:hypothetical protein